MTRPRLAVPVPLARSLARALPLLALAACAGGTGSARKEPLPVFTELSKPPDPAPEREAPPVLIVGGTVMTAAGHTYAPGYVLMRSGRIEEIGPGTRPAPSDATVVDARGGYVTPGIIDPHTHLGVYPLPGTDGNEDGNEMTSPDTAEVWAEHGVWPQDPGFWRALAGGVTTAHIVPGSANIFGGRSIVVKLRPRTSARMMRFPGAPQGLKMACGENPKRVYGHKSGPATRMGEVARIRAEFQKAREYGRRLDHYWRDLQVWRDGHRDGEDPPEPPPRDFGLDSLLGVLRGDILLQMHCYRADEMSVMLDVAQEFGFHVRAFHHALEAYKIRDRLARENVATVTWADWWGFKMEALDGVPQNAAMVAAAGGRAVMHSDSPVEGRHLNQEAAKAMTSGRQAGIAVDENEALRWVTANPAWVLGIEDQTGTLERGKMADVVVWDGSPFSVYTRTRKVFIDGELVFDRERPGGPRLSDFELGQSGQEVSP